MERIATDAIEANSFHRKSQPSKHEAPDPLGDHLPYPFQDHDIKKGEISEELASLRRAFDNKR